MISPFRKSWLKKFTRSLFGGSRLEKAQPRRNNKLKVELLEDRIVPATYNEVMTLGTTLVVTTTTGGSASNIALTYDTGTSSWQLQDTAGGTFAAATGTGAAQVTGGTTNT